MNQDYIDYVESQITYLREQLKLNNGEEVTPLYINTVLSNYGNVGITLIGEYTRYKKLLFELQKEYSRWYDAKFMEVRRIMTSEYEGKTIKLSLKEIETGVKAKYEDDYWNWQDKINDMELRISFLRRLIDQWSKMDNVLNNLSKNMRQEMVSLSIENRLNKNEQVNNRRKVRTTFPEPKKKRTPVDD